MEYMADEGLIVMPVMMLVTIIAIILGIIFSAFLFTAAIFHYVKRRRQQRADKLYTEAFRAATAERWHKVKSLCLEADDSAALQYWANYVFQKAYIEPDKERALKLWNEGYALFQLSKYET